MDNLLIALRAGANLYESIEKPHGSKGKTLWGILPQVIIGSVLSKIASVPEIVNLTSLRQLSLGSSEGTPLYEPILASALVRRTQALGDAGKAVDELLELVVADTGYARIVMVLAGVQTADCVELEPGIQLVPFKNLQPPWWMKEFGEESSWPLSRDVEPVAPSAGLVMRKEFSPLFVTEKQIEAKFPFEEVEILKTVAHCIAVAACRPPGILKVWFEDDDPRLPIETSGVGHSDFRWGSGAAGLHDIDATRVRLIIAHYRQFRGDRKPLNIAMHRLAGAWGGWYREERVIDLGIALETVLMHTKDGRPDDNNEISYKLGLRAGWLIGVDPATRRAVFSRVRRLYGFRSQAIHSGEVKTKKSEWRVVDQEIEAGIAFVGEIVIAVLARGDWPDWNELTLGAVSA